MYNMIIREVECYSIRDILCHTMTAKGKNGKEAAKEIGTSTSTISRIINGKGFELQLIIPIATWCDINAEELWSLLANE